MTSFITAWLPALFDEPHLRRHFCASRTAYGWVRTANEEI
jgi:hypothetical protein